jgi:hypothetical protein
MVKVQVSSRKASENDHGGAKPIPETKELHRVANEAIFGTAA